MAKVFPSNFKEVLIFSESPSDVRMFEEESLKETISLPRAHQKEKEKKEKEI